jgi:hypothetical protein
MPPLSSRQGSHKCAHTKRYGATAPPEVHEARAAPLRLLEHQTNFLSRPLQGSRTRRRKTPLRGACSRLIPVALATATFTTPDPLDGVDGTTTIANPYHYADNDPLNKTDPLGLRPGDDDTFDPPPVPIQAPAECLPGGAYPTLYFPGEFRDVAAEGYNSQPWYSKGDDVVTHAGAWAASVAWTASPVSLWDARTYLQHYLLGSGNDKNINVDKVLDDVSELRDEVSVRIERSIGDAGCNDPYFDSGWDTFGIEPSVDLNWFLVFHNFQLRVHGFVTSSGSTTTVRYRVAMADVYDFDPAEDDVLPDVLPFSYGDLHGLHTAGLAQNFVAHGQSRERVLTL